MKLSRYFEEIAGAISSSDFTGVSLPLIGMIRRPYPAMGTGAPGTSRKTSRKRKKRKKRVRR